MGKTLRYRKIWSTDNFRKYLYEVKAENPDLSLIDIMDNMVEQKKEERKKKNVLPRF